LSKTYSTLHECRELDRDRACNTLIIIIVCTPHDVGAKVPPTAPKIGKMKYSGFFLILLLFQKTIRLCVVVATCTVFVKSDKVGVGQHSHGFVVCRLPSALT
jgi:hypothetical protein